MDRYLYALVSRALKITGTYNPAETLPLIEEDLTVEDALTMRAFLQWCHDTGKGFGHGNYNERFAEWRASNG